MKKPSGEYKLRIIYFGNQERYDGETFAPTGSKKSYWLMTHMAFLLNLEVSSLDLENVFCHEPCPRDLYVTFM